jgi:hypothetical protein
MRWSGYAEPILMRLNGPFQDIRILTCFEPSKSVFKAWSNPTATATLTSLYSPKTSRSQKKRYAHC